MQTVATIDFFQAVGVAFGVGLLVGVGAMYFVCRKAFMRDIMPRLRQK